MLQSFDPFWPTCTPRWRAIVAGVLTLACTGTAAANEKSPGEIPAAGAPSLSASRLLVVGSTNNLYPYSFLDEHGQWDGFNTQLLDAVARVMKLNIRRVSGAGSEFNGRFERGEFDVMQSFIKTPQRDAFADFTMPLLTLQSAVFVRRDDSSLRTIADLKGRKIAIVNRNSPGERFLGETGLQAEVQFVDSTVVAMQLVDSGAVAATFLARYTALSNIARGHMRKVVMLGDPLPGFDIQYCFAVHKDNAKLLATLNEGLALLHQSGEYQRIYQHWFGQIDAPMISREQVIFYAAIGLGVAFVVALAGFWRARALGRRVRQLNAQLEERVALRTAELATRVTEVELLNHELESFSYSVSHDLRAPLRNITGFLELLTRRTAGRLDEEETRYVSTVSREAARMGGLIDDLLELSRVGRTAMKLGPVPLAELVAEVRAELRSAITGRAIEWRVGELPVLEGDRTLLRQVVANLLGNAVKFTRPRNPAVIEISALPPEGGDRLATIVVRDNGAGFNPMYSDKLFGVFQRLHNQRDFEGTGIGLANVKRIVTRHGGQVWGEGKVDNGAAFYFKLNVYPS